MSEPVSHPVVNLRLINEQRSRLRDTEGFLKSHRIPKEVNDYTQRFLGRIAGKDISDDLDVQFDAFRKHMKLKRGDMKVTEPDHGTGAIVTPWFEYRLTVLLDPDNAADVIWRRQISEFPDATPLMSPEFARVFGNMFDTVEFDPPDAVDIESLIDRIEGLTDQSMSIQYDRTATWCEVTIRNVPAVLKIAADCIALRATQPQPPGKLLDGFFQFHKNLPMDC